MNPSFVLARTTQDVYVLDLCLFLVVLVSLAQNITNSFCEIIVSLPLEVGNYQSPYVVPTYRILLGM